MWLILALVVLIGAVVPAALMALRGDPLRRLVLLQQLSTSVVVLLLLFAQVAGRSDYLVVPLALVLLSFTGALVFVRLLVPRR